MAVGDRVIFVWDCGYWWVDHASVDGPVAIHICKGSTNWTQLWESCVGGDGREVTWGGVGVCTIYIHYTLR